jgi:hypothetical protein
MVAGILQISSALNKLISTHSLNSATTEIYSTSFNLIILSTLHNKLDCLWLTFCNNFTSTTDVHIFIQVFQIHFMLILFFNFDIT